MKKGNDQGYSEGYYEGYQGYLGFFDHLLACFATAVQGI